MGGFGEGKVCPIAAGYFLMMGNGRERKISAVEQHCFVSLDIVIPRYPMIETLLSAGPLSIGCFWRLMAREVWDFILMK